MHQEPLCHFHFDEEDYKDERSESYQSSTSGIAGRSIRQKGLAGGQSGSRSRWKAPPQAAHSSSDEQEQPAARSVATGATTNKHHKNRTQGKHHGRSQSRRRFGKERHSHLRSQLLSTTYKFAQASAAPDLVTVTPLTTVLETITNAWPSSKDITFLREETPTMKDETSGVNTAIHTLERRRSVPEEIIRKFNVSHEKTSESETNATMPEITPPSSLKKIKEKSKERSKPSQKMEKANLLPVADPPKRKKVLERSFRVVDNPKNIRSAEEGSSDSDSSAPGVKRFNTIKRAPLRRESAVTGATATSNATARASQVDYDRNGQGIIKIASKEKPKQITDCATYLTPRGESETTPSAREESESGQSSDSLSSPRMCTQHLSSSENQSTDSEEINCTCAEIVSSKGTSTDPNHSGKSTLSQTVSDKSTSTQDSTMSVQSMSSRGSTITAATDSSSTELDPRTSAKETTTDYDHTPRSPHNSSKNSKDRRSEDRRETPPRRGHSHHEQNRNSREYHGPQTHNRRHQVETQIESRHDCSSIIMTRSCPVQTSVSLPHVYEWSQLSQEEIELISKERTKKNLELKTDINAPSYSKELNINNDKSEVCTNSGNTYYENTPIIVPRYSAMPRTMSMVVNASSFEVNNNSDSDCHSLADSLEDGQNRSDLKFYDTKQESKPVRGGVQQIHSRNGKKEPKGRAYFYSIDDDGTADLITSVYKIPELPDELKSKIKQRHENLFKLHEERRAHVKPLDTKEKKEKKKIRPKRLRRKKKEEMTNNNIKDLSAITASHETQRLKVRGKTKETNGKAEDKAFLLKETPRFISKIPTPVANSNQNMKSPTESHENVIQQPSSIVGVTSNSVNNIKSSGNNAVSLKSQNFSTSASVLDNNRVEKSFQDSQPSVDVDALTRHRLSLISSLEATALFLKAQAAESLNTSIHMRGHAPSKRPLKFRQRFEVIPEERSSSLSSADECLSDKNRRRSLPVKLTEPTESPRSHPSDTDGKSFRRYSLGSLSNYVITKLMGRPLQAIPCIQRGPNNENQQIIIFSPKDPTEQTSSKGRDALLAMNRADFDRLSKGWMNFYLLKESSDSDSEGVEDYEADLNIDRQKNDNNNGTNIDNTIVCRLPSMERDPTTTSESGTDDANIAHLKIPSIPARQLNRRFSLMLKNAGENIFELEECLTESNPDIAKQESKYQNQAGLESTQSGCEISLSEEKRTSEIKTNIAEKNWKKNNDLETNVAIIEGNGAGKSLPKLIEKSQSIQELSVPIKMSSSNTVLKPKNTNKDPKASGRTCSLPELKVQTPQKPSPAKAQSLVESLPKVAGISSDSGTDSDSTEYLNPPSPQLPKLPLEDCCCSSEDTSSDLGDFESSGKAPYRDKPHLPLRRRPLPFRPKHRFGFYESVHSKKPGTSSGWSVTVEGTIAFPRTRPDVQMRLSFPEDQGPPTVSQSDSGFVEERNNKSRTAAQQKQHWTVTVNNPTSVKGGKEKRTPACRLPNLSQHQSNHSNQANSRASKETSSLQSSPTTHVNEKLSQLWPKMQQVIEQELNAIRWDVNSNGNENNTPLSIEGRAISFEEKPRAPKMSERDLTRRSTTTNTSVATTYTSQTHS